MHRVIDLIDTYEPPSLTSRMAARIRAWLDACSVEVRVRTDEHRLRDADPRMLEDVGLTHGAVARGALRTGKEG